MLATCFPLSDDRSRVHNFSPAYAHIVPRSARNFFRDLPEYLIQLAQSQCSLTSQRPSLWSACNRRVLEQVPIEHVGDHGGHVQGLVGKEKVSRAAGLPEDAYQIGIHKSEAMRCYDPAREHEVSQRREAGRLTPRARPLIKSTPRTGWNVNQSG